MGPWKGVLLTFIASLLIVPGIATRVTGLSLPIETLTPPSVPHSNGGVALHDGKVHVWSGLSYGTRITDHEVYDPAADSWSTASAAPSARSGMAAFELNGNLYSIGGEGPGSASFTNTVYRYDPDNDLWTTLNPFPVNVWDPQQAVCNGNAYIIGGRRGYGRTYGDVWEYSEGTDNWISKVTMPVSVFEAGCAIYGDKIYVIGGNHKESEATGEHLRIVQVYDPSADSWQQIDNIPVTPWGAGAVAGPDGIFVLFQQQVLDNGALAPNPYAYHYSPDNGQWTTYDISTPSDVRYLSPIPTIGAKAYIIGDEHDSASAYVMSIPEPASLTLVLLGGVGLVAVSRHRRR